MERRRYTDDEIRRILDTETGYGNTDYWDMLERSTSDPKLLEEIRYRWQAAYHAEEHYAGIL